MAPIYVKQLFTLHGTPFALSQLLAELGSGRTECCWQWSNILDRFECMNLKSMDEEDNNYGLHSAYRFCQNFKMVPHVKKGRSK